jgi:glycosyltransferase involved in cell wall biosynthesis
VPSLLVVTTVPVTHEAFLGPIAAHMRGLGWTVHGMAAGISASEACVAMYDEVIDVGWTRNPADLGHLRSTLETIRGAARRHQYDIVHVHTPVAAFVTRFALRRLRRAGGPRVVYTAHGFHFSPELGRGRNAVFATLERIAGRWTDRLIVINRDDRASALRYHIVPEDRLCFMPGIGVDTDRISPAAVTPADCERVRAELGLAAEDVLFLMIAEFTPRKRQSAVCHALARTADPRLHIAFAGTGALESAVAKHARTLGLAGRAHFLGYRRDIPELLSACRATVLFSAHEGLPRSSMESLAMERPVIGSNIRGLRDLIDGGCGILVPPGDVQALADAMDYLAANPAESAAMGSRGRQKMCGAYTTAAIVSTHERLYDELLGPL